MQHVNDIDDRWGRWLGGTAFGLSIPHVTGLFGSIGPEDPLFWAGTLWFVALALAIWHGNRWLLFRQRERLDWFTQPIGKVAFMVVGCVFYTAPVTAAAIGVWFVAAGLPVDPSALTQVVLVNVICVLVVTHIYETVFLIKARRDDLVLVERLKRAQAEGELQALRSQLDPHFLFNSLTTLEWLIARDAEAAADYTARLAQVYRYILANRERDLVQLRDEVQFTHDCFHLLAVRFGSALSLRIDIGPTELDRRLLPPISLQLLLENAVKHNAFSEREPLDIEVSLRGGGVEMHNPRRPRLGVESEGVGLANLAERYRLLLQRDITVDRGSDRFVVHLPLVEVA